MSRLRGRLYRGHKKALGVMETFAIWIVVIVHEGKHLLKLKLSEFNFWSSLNVRYILMKLKNKMHLSWADLY